MRNKIYYVDLMMCPNNRAIYVGVTNDLIRRVYEHECKLADSFTKKYNINKLVYFEQFMDPLSAVTREKQLKGGSRKKKLDLIVRNNSEFNDLYGDLL